jgi:branched-chain amino acid transport system permease protein
MLGAYFAYLFFVVLEWPYFLSFFSAIVVTGFSGVILERIAIRPLIKRKANMSSLFMITLAISMSLKSSVRIIGGGFEKPFPSIFSTTPINIYGIFVTRQQFLVVFSTISFMILLGLFFKWSTIGKGMRGTSSNKFLARLSGINVSKMYSLTWLVASVFGSIAGVLVAPIILIYPDMGGIVVKGIAASVIGGLNSIKGAVVGGFLIGLLENLGGGYLSTSFHEITAFLTIILVLAIRPSGLFGTQIEKRV